MTTTYWAYPDGSVGQIIVDPGGHVPAPPGARQVSRAEYETLLARVRQAVNEHKQRLRGADLAAARAVHDELRALGLTASTASRISGYTGKEAG